MRRSSRGGQGSGGGFRRDRGVATGSGQASAVCAPSPRTNDVGCRLACRCSWLKPRLNLWLNPRTKTAAEPWSGNRGSTRPEPRLSQGPKLGPNRVNCGSNLGSTGAQTAAQPGLEPRLSQGPIPRLKAVARDRGPDHSSTAAEPWPKACGVNLAGNRCPRPWPNSANRGPKARGPAAARTVAQLRLNGGPNSWPKPRLKPAARDRGSTEPTEAPNPRANCGPKLRPGRGPGPWLNRGPKLRPTYGPPAARTEAQTCG